MVTISNLSKSQVFAFNGLQYVVSSKFTFDPALKSFPGIFNTLGLQSSFYCGCVGLQSEVHSYSFSPTNALPSSVNESRVLF